MAERDRSQREVLFSDVPGDREKVRALLAQWGVEESSIQRLMRDETRAGAEGVAPAPERVPMPRGRTN